MLHLTSVGLDAAAVVEEGVAAQVEGVGDGAVVVLGELGQRLGEVGDQLQVLIEAEPGRPKISTTKRAEETLVVSAGSRVRGEDKATRRSLPDGPALAGGRALLRPSGLGLGLALALVLALAQGGGIAGVCLGARRGVGVGVAILARGRGRAGGAIGGVVIAAAAGRRRERRGEPSAAGSAAGRRPSERRPGVVRVVRSVGWVNKARIDPHSFVGPVRRRRGRLSPHLVPVGEVVAVGAGHS